jgi:hypothetical protein
MEVIAKDLQEIPSTITQYLSKLREQDRKCKKELDIVKRDEELLLAEVLAITKSGNKDFDETPYQERLKELNTRRQTITRQLDHQVQITQYMYDLIDGKISYLGKNRIYD